MTAIEAIELTANMLERFEYKRWEELKPYVQAASYSVDSFEFSYDGTICVNLIAPSGCNCCQDDKKWHTIDYEQLAESDEEHAARVEQLKEQRRLQKIREDKQKEQARINDMHKQIEKNERETQRLREALGESQ